MGFEGHGTGGAGGDDAYEGDPPSDPVQTKLELAKAYIDIGNHENAVEILIEVVNEGNEGQVLAAQMLLSNIKH
jgi:pilus assembly protein FimV